VDKGWIAVAFIAVALFSTAYVLTPIESAIPPTRAFSSVKTDSGIIQAGSYNAQLIAPKPPYAQISDSTTQATAAAGAASNITLNTNDEIYGITHSVSAKTHEIIIQESGIYQIIAVPQIGEVTVQADGVYNIWLVKNGVKIPNTNVKTHVIVTASGDETSTETLNWIGRLNQNDVIYFQQSSTDPDIGTIFTAAAIPPATPSIIVSIFKINW